MKFALLGAEPDVLSLLAAIQSTPQHNLVAAYESQLGDADESSAIALQRGLGTADTDEQWESLIVGSVADAVIVCRGGNPDHRAEQLRKLTQAGIPLVIMHPVGEAVLAFELLMIQQDAGGLILPYQPEIDHAVLRALLKAATDGDRALEADETLEFDKIPAANKVQQLSVERRLVDQSGESVKQQFARDALTIRQLMGRIDQINALAATQDRDNFAGLSVQMSDEHGAVARWALLPATINSSSENAATWTVHRADGTSLTAVTPADVRQWALAGSPLTTQTPDEAAAEFLQRFSTDWRRHSNGQAVSRPDWEDACRAIELVENIDLSRRRKKTISLYYEDISEENTFKSLMAAGGCLILILLTLLLPALAAVESILRSAQDTSVERVEPRTADRGDSGAGGSLGNDPSSASPFLTTSRRSSRDRGWFGYWPMLLFMLLAVFIGLQFLRFATRSAATDSKKRPPPSSPE